MSLINDALKKAQRQRAEGSTPPAEISSPADSQEPLQRVARRAKPAAFQSQLMLIGGGAAVVALLAIGAVFFLRTDETPTPAPKAVQVAPAESAPSAPPATVAAVVPVAAPNTPAPGAAAPSIAPAVALPPAPSAVATASPVAAPAEIPAPAPATSAPVPAQYVLPTAAATASAPTTVPPPSVATTAPAERPKASTRMIAVIEHLKVGGIRVAGVESKVLMNDRVYRLNDVVDFELTIRLTGIEAKALTFEDARGAVHVRTF